MESNLCRLMQDLIKTDKYLLGAVALDRQALLSVCSLHGASAAAVVAIARAENQVPTYYYFFFTYLGTFNIY